MSHNDAKTFDLEVDSGIGPSGPDAPKLFTGDEIPVVVTNKGSRFFHADGSIWKYKVFPDVPVDGWVKESLTDLTEAEAFMDSPEEQTASDGWVSKNGFPYLTIDPKTAGTISIRWSMEVGQSKANKVFGYRVRWRPEGGTWADLVSLTTSVGTPNDIFLQGGFADVELLTDDKIEVDVQHGQTTATGNSILRNVTVEIRRIGD